MRRLLILCPHRVGERMSGMAIRYSEIARALAGEGIEVTLAGHEVTGSGPPGVELATWDADRADPLRALLRQADAVLSPPGAPHIVRELRRADARLAVDLYDPDAFEILERYRDAPAAARSLHATTAGDRLVDVLRHGHFFICASERQRDLWLGAMLALGLITPAAYEADPTLRRLIDVVPFGVPAEPPRAPAADPIRERFPGIGADERILLWNGGLWRWLDAPTAIRALARMRADGTAARLVFMGASEEGGGAAALEEARAVVAQEGLGDAVLFNDGWVEYDERGGWLLAADAVVSTHRDHLESRFAFRTRVLDCLWAGVPPVLTGGDELAAQVAAGDLGAVAEPGDADGVASGIRTVLGRERGAYGPGLRAAAEAYEWPRVVEPLSAFLRGDAGAGPGTSAPLLARPGARPLRSAGRRLTRLARMVRG